MKRSIKRILVFIWWLLIQYANLFWNVIRLKGLERRSSKDRGHPRQWLLIRTLLIVLISLGLFLGQRIIWFFVIVLVTYLFFLQEYEREEWVGWYRKRYDKKHGLEKKPWHLKPDKKEIL